MAFEMISEALISIPEKFLFDMKIQRSTNNVHFLLENRGGMNEIRVLDPESNRSSIIAVNGAGNFHASCFALMSKGYLLGGANSIKMYDRAGTYLRDKVDIIGLPLSMCWHGETLMVATMDSDYDTHLWEVSDVPKKTEFDHLKCVESRNGRVFAHVFDDATLTVKVREGNSWNECMHVSPAGYRVWQSQMFPDGRLLTREESLKESSPRLCVYVKGSSEPLHAESLRGLGTQHIVRVDNDGFVYHACLYEGRLRLRKMRTQKDGQ